MLRSWNSSSTMVRNAESSGSCCRRAVSTPSVATSSRVRGAESALEADLPADLAADRPAALVGDALRDRARGDAPRLQQDHAGRRRRAPAARASSCPRRAAR